MRDPALVLGAHLARAVDAAHAQHRGRQAEAAGRSRARTGPPRPSSSHRACGNRAGGPRRCRAGGWQDRAAHRRRPPSPARRRPGRHRPCWCWRRSPARACRRGAAHRAPERAVQVGRRNPRADRSGWSSPRPARRGGTPPAHRPPPRPSCGVVADVGDHREMRRGWRRRSQARLRLDARPRERIVDQHVVAIPRQPVGEIGADEAGAAGDENGPPVMACGRVHATSPRASSSRRAS